jgi:hypothetical protein
MRRFTNGQRVLIQTCPAFCDEGVHFRGETGTVVRLRIADDGAWVRLDRIPPNNQYPMPFPLDDDRANHVLLYPCDCVAALSSAPAESGKEGVE